MDGGAAISLRSPQRDFGEPGPNAAEQMRQNLDRMKHPIPMALWADLRQEGLIHPEAPPPD
jgi:D-threo-aldose 1-dehydrogenase